MRSIMRGIALVYLASACILPGLAFGAEIVSITMYTGDRQLAEILHLIKTEPQLRALRNVPICFGSYGPDAHQAELIHSAGWIRGCYAPIVNGSHYNDLMAPLSTHKHTYDNGLAVGRWLRKWFKEHAPMDAWHYDELSHSLWNRKEDCKFRKYVIGVLRGLYYGERGVDKPMPGFLYVDRPEAFVQFSPDPACNGSVSDADFLNTVDQVSIAVMGEEFIDFAGKPVKAAKAQQARIDASLGRFRSKYIPLFTPGYQTDEGYNGDIIEKGKNKGKERHGHGWVDRWRKKFIRQRVQDGVAGLGEYRFDGGNASTGVIKSALAALAYGIMENHAPGGGVPVPTGGASSGKPAPRRGSRIAYRGQGTDRADGL